MIITLCDPKDFKMMNSNDDVNDVSSYNVKIYFISFKHF